MAILRRWLAIALGELLLSILLIAIAPTFLNSKTPWIGFAIWLAIPGMVGGSILHVTMRSLEAQRAHRLFCQTCPHWRDSVSPVDFLDIPLETVKRTLPQLQAWEETDETQALHLSPLDLLR